MALKASIDFQLGIKFDGSSTTLTVAFSTAPFLMVTGDSNSLSGFSLSNMVPSSVENLSLGGFGGTISATIGMLGTTVTFTFSEAPIAQIANINGTFVF